MASLRVRLAARVVGDGGDQVDPLRRGAPLAGEARYTLDNPRCKRPATSSPGYNHTMSAHILPARLSMGLLGAVMAVAACGGAPADPETETAIVGGLPPRPPEAMEMSLIERLEAYRPLAIDRDDDGTITELNLASEELVDADIEAVAALDSLEVLLLGDTGVDDRDLETLSALPRLKVMGLRETGVTDTGMIHLAAMTSLEEVYLGSTAVSDAGVERLAGLPALTYLGLKDTLVDRRGIELLAGTPTIETLNLALTAADDTWMPTIASMPKLRRLFLAQTAVGDEGVAVLAVLDTLEALDLYGTEVTDGVAETLAAMPGLRAVDLRATAVTRAGIAVLAERRPDLTVAVEAPEDDDGSGASSPGARQPSPANAAETPDV